MGQALAAIVLWVAAVRLVKTGRHVCVSPVTALPAAFLSAMAMMNVLASCNGLCLNGSAAHGMGVSFAMACLIVFLVYFILKRQGLRRLHKWAAGVLIAAFAAVLCAAVAGALPVRDISPEQLYERSVDDAVFADADEIEPLVVVSAESDLVTWDADRQRVLMLSWHRHPERYRAGESWTVGGDGIWTFTDREMIKWYSENAKGIPDMTLRLEQLIGLPPQSGYTHMSAFWCEPDELIRPAYETSILCQQTAQTLDGAALGEHESWFHQNILWSYFDSAYPWTRLGYTYDWADNGREYGLTEFLILPDASVEIEWTMSTDEFIRWLSQQV